jgi:hypothetical protein
MPSANITGLASEAVGATDLYAIGCFG